MIKKINIEELGTIWKLHYDVNSDDIFLELRHDKSFELKSISKNKNYLTKSYEQYVQNIISIQYPYVVLSYRHIDNLLDDQIISLYNLETEKEIWLSSDIRIDEVYNQSLKVYHPKISPKSFYYIDFQKQELASPLFFEKNTNIVYANNTEHITELIDDNTKVLVNFNDESVKIYNEDRLLFEDEFYLNEDYRSEYEYLMKVNDYIVFILGKHKMNIYQIKANNS